MKRVLSLVLAVFFVAALCLPASAEGDYRSDIYRFNDFTDSFDDGEIDLLDSRIVENVKKYKIDFPIYVFDTLGDDEDISEKARGFYESNGFGYGASKSGVILAVAFKGGEFGIYRYGEAEGLINDNELEILSKSFIADFTSELSDFGLFDTYIKDVAKAAGENLVSDSYGYYDGTENKLIGYTGEELPRVVDNAGKFTEDQKNELAKRIDEMSAKNNASYVIFTDTTNNGLSPEEYSSDFLHYLGYGDETGGAVVFYISFDPSNCCWRTTSIDDYEDLFTESVFYDIDEAVQPYFDKADYYGACLKHISISGEVISGDYHSPIPLKSVLIIIGAGAIAGLIAGGLHISKCKKEMRVTAPVGAREYLVNNSFVLRDKNVRFLYANVTRTAKPKSGSSGGSSYSHGSSSGGSYSSGGRSF